MNYNIFIKTKTNVDSILFIDEDDLKKLVGAYNLGKESIFIDGEKCFLKELSKIKIYNIESKSILTKSDIEAIFKLNRLFQMMPFGEYESKVNTIFSKLGSDKTREFINNDFGNLKMLSSTDSLSITSSENFVEPSRIKELLELQSSAYDLTKLIRITKELNIAFKNNCFLTIPLLIRSIMDHVPPIFSKQTFAELCGSYGSRSFKDSMTNLEKSSRKIADSYLHSPIRIKEALPNKTQINFSQDLDVLLQEIVRINKIV